MALIVVIAVMNGFQSTSINSLLEISSYHVKCEFLSSEVLPSEVLPNEVLPTEFSESSANKYFENLVSSMNETQCVLPMMESQALLVGSKGKQNAAIIRGVVPDIALVDSGFAQQAKIVSGSFDLTEPKTVVLGSTLSKRLGVRVGEPVSVLLLSGDADTELFADDRELKVTGIFECPYLDINAGFAFTSLETARSLLGEGGKIFYGVKLKDKNKDAIFMQKLMSNIDDSFIDLKLESWRVMNKSFFGALRIEKNVLFLLVLLIFLVVGINIYNGMRRMVFERKEDICVLYALGASKKQVQFAFILQGLYVAFLGCLFGLVIGLLISSNMHYVFIFLSQVIYAFQYFFTMIFSPQNAHLVSENYIFLYYADIPAVIGFWETFYIVIFGILASLVSSYFASRKLLKFQVSEVLRDE